MKSAVPDNYAQRVKDRSWPLSRTTGVSIDTAIEYRVARRNDGNASPDSHSLLPRASQSTSGQFRREAVYAAYAKDSLA